MTADISVPGVEDGARLARWIEGQKTALPPGATLTGVKLIAGGRSNLTYRLDFGDQPLVLRRPPLGHVLPTAHDMSREYRVLTALHGTNIPVARPVAYCADTEIIGSPFYLMEYVDGLVLRTPQDGAQVSPDQARLLSELLTSMMAAIHGTDLPAVGLDTFGRPEGFMARQLARWQKQWELSKTQDVPGYDDLVRRLSDGLPARAEGTLVHGDYRLDNMLVRLDGQPRIAAVVDWEMATLGDPLADLGLTLMYWADAADDERLPAERRRRGDPAARLLQPGRGGPPVRRADRPRRVRDRLLHGLRLLQAGRRAGGHQRALPAGQDRGRGLRAGGHDGRRAGRARAPDAGY